MPTAKKTTTPVAKKSTPPRRPVIAPGVGELLEGAPKVNVALATEKLMQEEKVTVVVPKPFTLTRDSTKQPVHFEAGVQEMFVSDAEHWFSKSIGVVIYDKKG